MQTRDEVEGFYNCREFSQPLECLYQAIQIQERSFLLLLKITLMRGGHAKKIGNLGGGVIQFSNYTPPNPASPPYPIKNERSLRPKDLV